MKKIFVLCYHSIDKNRDDYYSVSPHQFMKQIVYLKKHFDIVDLDTIVSMVQNNVQPDRNTVAITIDDGYADIKNILPFIDKYGIPVTLFMLAKPYAANRSEIENTKRLLSMKELKRLVKAGVSIASHGCTHAPLQDIGIKQMQEEVCSSKQILEENLSIKIKYFSYPKGKTNTKLMHSVEQAGYIAAFSTEPHSIKNGVNVYSIPRIIMDQPLAQIPLNVALNPCYLAVKRLSIALRLGRVIHAIRKNQLN